MSELAAALERIAAAPSPTAILEAAVAAVRTISGAETVVVMAQAPAPAGDLPAWTGRASELRDARADIGAGEGYGLVARIAGAESWLMATRSQPAFAPHEIESAVLLGAFVGQTIQALAQKEAASAQQSIYRTLVEQLPAVTYYRKLDAPGGVAWFVSPQVKTVLGIEPEGFFGSPERWRSMLHPEDRDRVVAEQSRFDPTKTSAPIDVEYRMVRPDGQTIWIQNTALAVRDSEGNPQFVLGVLSDVTERKRAEEELRQSLKRQAVAHLAAGVAHDFNNVLGAILAYASLLRDEVDDGDDDKRLALDEIAAAARRGYSLTRELAAIAEPAAARSKAERAPAPEVALPSQPRPPAAQTGKTILVVDDEDAVRRATAAILARRGYRVLAASSGPEALALLAGEPDVDLLLTDVIMPEMGGRDLAARARAVRGDLKVAFISGFTDDEILRRAVSDADFALLQKPFSSAELIAHVQAAMGG